MSTIRRVTTEEYEGDQRVFTTHDILEGGGDTLILAPVEVAAAETDAAREALDQRIRKLWPIIGPTRAAALDTAAAILEGAVRAEVTSRVVAALTHDSPAANTLLLFQRRRAEADEPTSVGQGPATARGGRRRRPRPYSDHERVIIWRIFTGYAVVLAAGIAAGAAMPSRHR